MRWRIRILTKRSLQSILLILILYVVTVSPMPAQAQAEYDDLTGVNVAVYRGVGVMSSSRIALTRMFEWMNATVSNVTSSQIRDDVLTDFDILVVPGGSESTASSELDSEGRQKIKDFVAGGGSYFGICGGATFGANYLRFLNGFMSQLTEPGGIIHMTTMHVNQSSTGPDLSDCPENVTTMYYGSQYFVPRAGFTVHTIATYDYNGEAGMIAFEHQNGTVFLSSPHPEYEESDDRDDTTFGSGYDDPESEWDILFRVSNWLVEASVVEANTTTTVSDIPLYVPLIGIVSIGAVAIVLVVSILYRRKSA
ncbi:MAG: BPL-N domain-containing protein [Candidatus Thorarchaeota archaeon]|jgi:glutamine amidotransferase-like uncharacterized protein